MEDKKNLFTLKEFGRRNSVSRATVYRLIDKKKLRVTKIGRRSLISAESEKVFLDSLPTGGPELLKKRGNSLQQ